MRIPLEIDLESVPFPPSIIAKEEVIADNKQISSMENHQMIFNTENNIKGAVQLSNQIWRLCAILKNSESDCIKPELNKQEIRKISNIAEAMQEIVKNLGIRVIDRCGEDFHPGLPDVVVTEEPKEGISKERIIRTIRPTILYGQTMVQRGEIDIAVPMEKKP